MRDLLPSHSLRPVTRLRFAADNRGAIGVLAALLFPILIGFAALAVEYGNGLLVKGQNQRIADLAAYAGALAYSSSGSTDTMTAVAKNVAALNGISASDVQAQLVSSPRLSSSSAVNVKITTTNNLFLSRVLSNISTLSIASSAYAQLGTQTTSACILALSPSGAGVTLEGGTTISASSCAINSNAALSVPCGTTMAAKIITYNSSSAPSQPCKGISGTITKTATSDPFANDSSVTTATSRLATVSALSSPGGPSAPSVPNGTDISFDWTTSGSSSATARAATVGCTASWNQPTWTLTCPAGGTYAFGSISVGGGITVKFDVLATGSSTYTFSGGITTAGTMNFGPGTYKVKGNITTAGTTGFGAGTYTVGGTISTTGTTTFGAGTYIVAQGIKTGGGSTTTFGAGSFTLGRGSATCDDGGYYSLCNTGTTLTFAGPSTFVLSSGFFNKGGATLVMGSGTTNSFNIGASSNGNAIYLGGGSKTTMADATGTSSLFQLVGNLNASAGGGSCFMVSAAAQHDIQGYIAMAGGTILGTGPYTVTGYVALGANGGGKATCNGTEVGMSGTDVTFTIGANTVPNSGSCPGYAFCVAAGFSNVTITAPKSGALANLLVVGPITASNKAGASFVQGASGTSLSGAFYFPNGPIALSGGASIGDKSGQCLQLIGSQITLSGGTAAASSCVSASGSGSGGSSSIVLVQ